MYKLSESEFRFAKIVWRNEPLSSGALVKICGKELGWKKSTTYTVLKKLCDNKILQNNDSIVSSLVGQKSIEKQETDTFLNRTFNGSLPMFIAAFFENRGIGEKEAEELKNLIDKYKED